MFYKKVLRSSGVEVAEVGVVIDTHVGAEGVLGTVEVEVAKIFFLIIIVLIFRDKDNDYI